MVIKVVWELVHIIVWVNPTIIQTIIIERIVIDPDHQVIAKIIIKVIINIQIIIVYFHRCKCQNLWMFKLKI